MALECCAGIDGYNHLTKEKRLINIMKEMSPLFYLYRASWQNTWQSTLYISKHFRICTYDAGSITY